MGKSEDQFVMDSYKNVVKEKYNSSQRDIYADRYSFVNTCGFYGYNQLLKCFYEAFNVIRKKGDNIAQFNFLDVGCGHGTWTEFYVSITDNASKVFGVDLSEERLAIAKKRNSGVDYQVKDMVKDDLSYAKANFISALTVFMFLKEKNEIHQALKNINTSLQNGGYFLWVDAYHAKRFNSTAYAAGFTLDEMLDFARQTGFKPIYKKKMYKLLLGRYHTLFLREKLPNWVVSLVEKMVPSPPGNIFVLFQKV